MTKQNTTAPKGLKKKKEKEKEKTKKETENFETNM